MDEHIRRYMQARGGIAGLEEDEKKALAALAESVRETTDMRRAMGIITPKLSTTEVPKLIKVLKRMDNRTRSNFGGRLLAALEAIQRSEDYFDTH